MPNFFINRISKIRHEKMMEFLYEKSFQVLELYNIDFSMNFSMSIIAAKLNYKFYFD